MPDFFRRTGLLPGTALVVGSNAPAATRHQAQILKARYGDLVQVCAYPAPKTDNVEMLAAINALPTSGGTVLLVGDFDFAAKLSVASDRKCVLKGMGQGITVIRRNPGVTQRIIEFEGSQWAGVEDLTLDGQATAYVVDTESLVFNGVTHGHVHRVAGIGGSRFAFYILNSDDVDMADIYCESSAAWGLDGIQARNSRQLTIRGVRGDTGDDLVCIAADARDVYGVTVEGVVGRSKMANVARLFVDGAWKMQGVNFKNVVALDAGDCGLYLGGPMDGTLEGCEFDVTVLKSTGYGCIVNADGIVRNCKIRGKMLNTGAGGALYAPQVLSGMDIDLDIYNVKDGSPAVQLNDISDSYIRLRGDYVNAGKSNLQPFLWFQKGDDNVFTGHLKGGSQSLHIGGYGNTPSRNRFKDLVLDTPTNAYVWEEGGLANAWEHVTATGDSWLGFTFSGTGQLFKDNRGHFKTQASGQATMPAILPTPPAISTEDSGVAGNVDIGTHSWKVTFTGISGGETLPSDKSNVVTIADTAKKVNLYQLPIGPVGTLYRKIYRTVAGDTGDWKLVGTLDNNEWSNWEDNVADANLGASAPTSNTTPNTIATVTHGLKLTPTRVQATPTSDPGAANAFWVADKGATTFTINAKVGVTSATTFDWKAQVGEE